ncbi:MAG: hypothetical protein HKN87_15315 [Saprospiraceae bacterium]|nr:hypothetical protein [Saprospiraceae bacterium]
MKQHYLGMVMILLGCGTFCHLLIFNKQLHGPMPSVASCKEQGHYDADFKKEGMTAKFREQDLESIQQLLTSSSIYWTQPEDEEFKFLSRIEDKNAKSMIRNGNFYHAMRAKENYISKLESFKNLCLDLQVSMNMRKRDFRQTLVRRSPRNRQLILRKWSNKRSALRKAVRAFRKQLRSTLAAERAIRRQQNHFPELAERMNSLQNFDHSKLPIYIFFHYRVTISLEEKLGLSIISYYKGLFTTDSPAANHLYPDLPGMEKALTVHLTSFPSGKILSHEFGHLHYLYHHWFDYQRYIQLMGTAYQPGGHGANDPSGIAANHAEKGILIE